MFYLNVIFQLVKYFLVAFIFILLKILGFISFTHMAISYLVYCIYVRITSKTYLYYTKNKKNEQILSKCPELSNPNFKPHFLLPFAFQQMILSLISLLIRNKPKLQFREQKNK